MANRQAARVRTARSTGTPPGRSADTPILLSRSRPGAGRLDPIAVRAKLALHLCSVSFRRRERTPHLRRGSSNPRPVQACRRRAILHPTSRCFTPTPLRSDRLRTMGMSCYRGRLTRERPAKGQCACWPAHVPHLPRVLSSQTCWRRLRAMRSWLAYAGTSGATSPRWSRCPCTSMAG